jgi:hypothetical protein
MWSPGLLDIGMGYELMIWQMTVSIRSSSISIWDILSLWPWQPAHQAVHAGNTPTPSHPEYGLFQAPERYYSPKYDAVEPEAGREGLLTKTYRRRSEHDFNSV